MEQEYSSKRFLNMEHCHSDASIHTYFGFWGKETNSSDGHIKIRDCHHTVTLSIGVEDEYEVNGQRDNDSYVNSINKIETMIEELTKFREVLFKARAEYIRRNKTELEPIQTPVPSTTGGAVPQG